MSPIILYGGLFALSAAIGYAFHQVMLRRAERRSSESWARVLARDEMMSKFPKPEPLRFVRHGAPASRAAAVAPRTFYNPGLNKAMSERYPLRSAYQADCRPTDDGRDLILGVGLGVAFAESIASPPSDERAPGFTGGGGESSGAGASGNWDSGSSASPAADSSPSSDGGGGDSSGGSE